MNNMPPKNTILCTWELGGQLGHITTLAHITQALEQHQYNCFLALKDLSRAKAFFPGSQSRLLQAPVFLPKITMQRPVICLADTLLLSGYLKTEELQGLVEAWHNLISLVNPAVLIMDYSPTAALAARLLPCRKIIMGSGFAQPAPGHPIRNWHPHQAQSEVVQRQEPIVVETINQVLSKLNQPNIKLLSDLFVAERTIITTPPEFDLYADLRQDAIYHCKMSVPGIEQSVQFKPCDRPRVLAYLKSGHPQFDLILQGLAASGANVFVACPRSDPKQLAPYESDHFSFSVEPVQLAQAMPEAQLFISHGNYGATMESLLYGTPVMALPIQLEQLLTAQILDKLEIGRMLHKVDSAQQVATAINAALSSDTLRNNTRSYADKHAHLISMSLGERIADECDALLNTAVPD